MSCQVCNQLLDDQIRTEDNIQLILQIIKLTLHQEGSVRRSARLDLLKKHLHTSSKILEDLLLVKSMECQECGLLRG